MEFFSCPETGTYLCYAYGRLSKKDAEKARRENDESNSIVGMRPSKSEAIWTSGAAMESLSALLRPTAITRTRRIKTICSLTKKQRLWCGIFSHGRSAA